MDETRRCPYCDEEIRTEATRCRYCRSLLTNLDPERWHRDHPERRVAGVASAVARAFTIPVGAARLGFIVLAFFHLFGLLLYVALWALIPFAPGDPSPLDRLRGAIQHLFGQPRRARDARPTANGADRGERPRDGGRAGGLPVSVAP